MFLIFFFLNIINVGINIISIYIATIAIENIGVNPSYAGKFPKKNCVKSQFGVIKYLSQSKLNTNPICVTNGAPIYPSSAIVIANALLVNIVLSANASVISGIYIPNLPNACIAK